MHCMKCGAQMEEGVKFCTKCGNAVQAKPMDATIEEVTNLPKKKHTGLKIFLGIAAVFTLIIVLFGAAGSDDNSQVTSSTDSQTDSQYITYVKEGHPELYPEIKYGEAFDSFFSAPSWSYFVSTEEEDVVEFSGGCIYQGANVTATIQFVLDVEDGTFEAGYFDMNGVPQDESMTHNIIVTVFEDYGKDLAGGSLDSMDQQTEDLQETEEIEQTKDLPQTKDIQDSEEEDAYADLEAFIACICSYSDPPELEGEELNQYFKEQYDIWKNGEGFYDVHQKEDGSFVYEPEEAMDYLAAYGAIVDSVSISYSEYCTYTLYDLDNDGVKELITSFGTCNADWRNHVYTIDNGNVSMIGEIESIVSFYVAEDGNGLYAVWGNQGYQSIRQITKTGNSINSETLTEGEVGSGDYYSNDQPVELISVSDKSLLSL